jgi:5-formyltetrahydrofolate cyclo-ligase
VNKEELRVMYKQVRLRMSAHEVSTKSRMINRKLLTEVDWTQYKNICVFEPIAKLNEVDTKPLLKRLHSQTNLKVQVLGHSKNAALPTGKFELILVPALAFDKDNYRLGWGGGWYDRFLAGQPDALKIGLCFQNGLVRSSLPIKPHDVQLDMVITEEKIYRL